MNSQTEQKQKQQTNYQLLRFRVLSNYLRNFSQNCAVFQQFFRQYSPTL